MKKTLIKKVELDDLQTLPKDIITYTTIIHEARLELGISLPEYCLADTIFHLSANPKNELQGWCYAAKETLAKMLGIGRASTFRHLSVLLKKGLVEKNGDGSNLLRITQKWYDIVELRRLRIKEIYKTQTRLINR